MLRRATAVATNVIAVFTTTFRLGANATGVSGFGRAAFCFEMREPGAGFGDGNANTSPVIAAATTAIAPTQTRRRRNLAEENLRPTAEG